MVVVFKNTKHCSKCNYSDNPLDTNHIARSFIEDIKYPEFIGDMVFYKTDCGLTYLCQKSKWDKEQRWVKKRDKELDKYFNHIRGNDQWS